MKNLPTSPGPARDTGASTLSALSVSLDWDIYEMRLRAPVKARPLSASALPRGLSQQIYELEMLICGFGAERHLLAPHALHLYADKRPTLVAQ
jgi:hypothetical protein